LVCLDSVCNHGSFRIFNYQRNNFEIIHARTSCICHNAIS